MDATVLFDLSYGVYVVTTWDEGRAVGCIANSVMQITASPMTIAVSMNKDNYTYDCLKRADKFAISILAEQSKPRIIGAFGFRSAADPKFEKFAEVEQRLVDQMPAVADSCGAITCRLIDSHDCGTHTIFIGEVIGAERFSTATPMTYSYYHRVIKGKSPKNAPTYQAEK